jgi:hypothetical protein
VKEAAEVKAAAKAAAKADSDAESEAGTKAPAARSKQATKRAGRTVKNEAQKNLAGAVATSASSSSTGPWHHVIEGVESGIEQITLAVEGMNVEGGGGEANPAAEGPRATTSRLCAEGGRAGSDAAGGSGAATSSGGSVDLPMTGGGDCIVETKNKLVCMNCKVPIRYMQNFLLLPGGYTGCEAEWEDSIWGHCEPCSGRIPPTSNENRRSGGLPEVRHCTAA